MIEIILEDSEGRAIEDFPNHFIIYRTKERKVIHVQTFWNGNPTPGALLSTTCLTSDRLWHSLLNTRHHRDKQCRYFAAKTSLNLANWDCHVNYFSWMLHCPKNIIVNLKQNNSTEVMMENGIRGQINHLKQKGMFTWHLNINNLTSSCIIETLKKINTLYTVSGKNCT